MPCIEIIGIRLAAGNIRRFKSIVEQLDGEFESGDLEIYQHAVIKNDFSIHLTHDGDQPHPDESALHVVSALKELGLVNHSIWVQVDRFQD